MAPIPPGSAPRRRGVKKSGGVRGRGLRDTARMNESLFPSSTPSEPTPASRASRGCSGPIGSNWSCARPISTGCCRPSIAPGWSGMPWGAGLCARCMPAVQAVEGHAGSPAIDPAIPMTLWLYATLRAWAARVAVARPCGEEHDARRQVCGGVAVNHHTLADFRVGSGEYLDEVLTTSVAALMAEGLVQLQRVAHDGGEGAGQCGRGSSPFGAARGSSAVAEATAQVGGVEARSARRAGRHRRGGWRRRGAAAARERQVTGGAALAQVPAVTARRKKAGPKGPARVSTTDPEARRMTMADGRVRPAFNVQLTTATESQVDRRRRDHDGGHGSGAIAAHGRAAAVAPRPRPGRSAGGWRLRHAARHPRPREPGRRLPRVRAARRRARAGRARDWRRRIDDGHPRRGGAHGHSTRRKRSTKSARRRPKCVNAQARNRGLQQFLVRGVRKVHAVLLAGLPLARQPPAQLSRCATPRLRCEAASHRPPARPRSVAAAGVAPAGPNTAGALPPRSLRRPRPRFLHNLGAVALRGRPVGCGTPTCPGYRRDSLSVQCILQAFARRRTSPSHPAERLLGARSASQARWASSRSAAAT